MKSIRGKIYDCVVKHMTDQVINREIKYYVHGEIAGCIVNIGAGISRKLNEKSC